MFDNSWMFLNWFRFTKPHNRNRRARRCAHSRLRSRSWNKRVHSRFQWPVIFAIIYKPSLMTVSCKVCNVAKQTCVEIFWRSICGCRRSTPTPGDFFRSMRFPSSAETVDMTRAAEIFEVSLRMIECCVRQGMKIKRFAIRASGNWRSRGYYLATLITTCRKSEHTVWQSLYHRFRNEFSLEFRETLVAV